MKAFVLVNAVAGRRAQARNQAELIRLRDAFDQAGILATIKMVTGGQLTSTAAAAAAEDFDVIVAAGGDGTVSAVARALIGIGKPLGVLPIGTLNHFAKDLGLPLDYQQAVAVIAAGRTRLVDVGEVNGLSFINNSSLGVYPAIVRDRDYQRKLFGRGKWFAMFLAGLRVFRRFPLVTVRLQTAEHTLLRQTPLVFVGNNQYQISKLTLGVRDCLSGGSLSLYAANCTSRLGTLWLMLRGLLGGLDQQADFDAICTSELWIDTPRPYVSVALDGEVVRLTPPLAYRSRPAALTVVANDVSMAGDRPAN